MITPAAGKRLIAKALVKHPSIQKSLKYGTLVIVAGTTNGYIAEEILYNIGQIEGFSRKKFFRGIVIPPNKPRTGEGRLPNEKGFPGDVIIKNGEWLKGKTIFDIIDYLKEGDVVLKGANALDIFHNQAGIYIGHPQGGTIGVALQAHVGRRVELILPVGLEKRITGNLNDLANKMNKPGIKGSRMLTVPGEVFTEINAVKILSGADAELVAAGGVAGAEGSVWLGIDGDEKQLESAEEWINSVYKEPAFSL
nr:hypothetical protein [Methanobacterium alcaliphilum]